MRRTALGLLVAVVACAPAGAAGALVAGARMTPEKYQTYLDRFNQGDERYADFYAPDVVFDHGPFYGMLRGRAAIVEFYRKISTQMKETVTPSMVVIDNEHGLMAAEIATRLTAVADGVQLKSGPLVKGETYVSYGTVYYTFNKQGRIATIRDSAGGSERIPASK